MNRRHVFLLAAAASWFLVIALRLYQLQVMRHDDYRKRAVRQQSRVIELTLPRGTLYDRRGQVLALSVEVQSVAADPTQVVDPASTAAALAEILDLDIGSLASALDSDREFVWVRRKIDSAQAEAVIKRKLKGVFLLPESKRYYPLRGLAAHVLGYVGIDNSGLAGLELFYDPVLASKLDGRVTVRDTSFGKVLYPLNKVSKTGPGQDLFLTLDAAIQHIVEFELREAIQSSHAMRGMVVVMNPTSGAILAMASFPTFDPNRIDGYPEEYLRNQPIMYAYEPGSSFQMITLAAALEAGAVNTSDILDCQVDDSRFGSALIRDDRPFGRLTVSQIIANSSNMGAIRIGESAGREYLFATIRAFGFGRPTGIDLPSEKAGFLRPVESWSPLSPAHHALGQEVSVTAIQLTAAFAVIANGGQLVKPFIVARVGQYGEGQGPERQRELTGVPISYSSVRQIRDVLESAVLHGTGRAAASPGYSTAGKTGTALKRRIAGGGYAAQGHVASFVGFAPVENPALVVTVVLDEPRPLYQGGEVAAPAFKAIVEKTLLYLRIVPNREAPADL